MEENQGIVIRNLDTLAPDITRLHGQAFPGEQLISITPLPADMSPRRYFRLRHAGPPLVAMVFDALSMPEAGGSEAAIDAYDAVILLTRYLSDRGMSVPRIYAESKDVAIILQDDFGDTFLADRATQDGQTLYKMAIDEVIRLQSAVQDKNFFALKRSFTTEVYFREMEETPNFYLSSLAAPPADSLKQEILTHLRELAERVSTFPQTIALRDYHSWNILVKGDDSLGIIDFQDALLAPRTYDLVSLLNDRDTDSLLGARQYGQLLDYFFSSHPQGKELREEYPLVLLQRDLKVAGRLSKMVHVRGLPKYSRWIPGTVRRIAHTLRAARDPLLKRLLASLIQADPEGFRS